MLIGDLLRRQAAPTGRPDKPALLFDGRAVTYAALDATANRIAHGLMARGVRPGDRVALLGRNSISWVAAYYATAKCGAVLVPVNFWYRTAELAYVLADSGARCCLLTAGLADVAAPLRADPSCPVEQWVWLDERPSEHGDAPTLDDLMAGQPAVEPLPGTAVAETDPHIILYTSGTTGVPKGAVLSHRAHVQHAATFALHTQATEADVYLNVYPLFHTGGTDCAVLPYHYVGATVALVADPKPEAVLEAIQRDRVTSMMAVPTVWRRVVEHPQLHRYDLRSFRRAMGSSDAMPGDLLERVTAAFGATWTQTYGLTEAGCILTYLPAADVRRKLGSAGKPHPQADLAIADPAGADDPAWPLEAAHRLPANRAGEVVARTEHLMNGYWNMPAQTAAAVRNGWLRTGDVGLLDDEGYLYIVGRLKDVIVSGGEKVYPAEVEPALAGYPGVAELALVGVPDREWGEAVAAVLVLQPGASFDPEQFKAWARRRVAGFKAPRHVAVVESLPRTTGTGKVQKAVLRERLQRASGSRLDIQAPDIQAP